MAKKKKEVPKKTKSSAMKEMKAIVMEKMMAKGGKK